MRSDGISTNVSARIPCSDRLLVFSQLWSESVLRDAVLSVSSSAELWAERLADAEALWSPNRHFASVLLLLLFCSLDGARPGVVGLRTHCSRRASR